MTAARAGPGVAGLDAPATWRAIDLLSDVHLHTDMPRTFDAWSRHMLATDADAVFILGDLFEVWVGDDARDGDFERRCVDVLRRAARRAFVAFMPGNRDFLVGDGMLAEAGLRRLADPTLLRGFGRRVLLMHGDALCLDDTDYQRFRDWVRGADWQRDFLARPLPERRALARAMRDVSSQRQAGMPAGQWADVDEPEALAWMDECGADTLVHGHTHRPASHPLPGGRTRQVLSDWDLDGPAPPRAGVLRLSAAGLRQVPLAG
jgi:UDP-2,3-diacylglucosamine hydrolase